MIFSSSQKRIGLGALENLFFKMERILNSRDMSCPDFTFAPKGGLRRTYSL